MKIEIVQNPKYRFIVEEPEWNIMQKALTHYWLSFRDSAMPEWRREAELAYQTSKDICQIEGTVYDSPRCEHEGMQANA